MKIQESINIEINSFTPNIDIFFIELSGIDENDINIDYSTIDFNTLGTYTVVINVLGEESTAEVNVVDVTRPTLELKNLYIEEGDSYSLDDFIVSCTDNSNEDCTISYKTGAVDDNDKVIDYSSYTKSGTYDIVILATDPSGNDNYVTTKLYISGENDSDTQEEEVPTPSSCKYGSDSYNNEYILTYDVTNNGCALSLDSYQTSSVKAPIENIADSEVTKLKTQIDAIADLTPDIVVNRSIIAILNDEAIGFVGYSLNIEVTNSEGEIIVSYYVLKSGSRLYTSNPYNLPE
ncbi:MAG: hypothetical protein R3Y13_04890 [bacterium]